MNFKTDIQDNKIVLNTSELSVSVDTGTGIVSYFSKDGKSLLAEKSGMQFIDFDDAGTKTYQVYQPFVLDKEEAIYGLGQLQNGKMIQRNMTKNLVQGNVEDVSPFSSPPKDMVCFGIIIRRLFLRTTRLKHLSVLKWGTVWIITSCMGKMPMV